MQNEYVIYSIEDDANIADIISLVLRGKGYEVMSFDSGEAFLKQFQIRKPNMILLDLMLPGIQGMELLKQIRSDISNKNIVIVVVSAKSMVNDKIQALDYGADDYIGKPFDIQEFVSRINAHYRRHQVHNEICQDSILKIGPYTIDFDNKTVHKGNTLISLTPGEYLVAEILFRNHNTTVSKASISDCLYGPTPDEEKLHKQFRTIDMHIKEIRQKLGDLDKTFISTVFGNGYRING